MTQPSRDDRETLLHPDENARAPSSAARDPTHSKAIPHTHPRKELEFQARGSPYTEINGPGAVSQSWKSTAYLRFCFERPQLPASPKYPQSKRGFSRCGKIGRASCREGVERAVGA